MKYYLRKSISTKIRNSFHIHKLFRKYICRITISAMVFPKIAFLVYITPQKSIPFHFPNVYFVKKGQFYCEILIWGLEIFGKIFEKNRPFLQRDPSSNNIFSPIPKDFFLKRTLLPTLNLQMTLFLDYLSPKPLSFKGILLNIPFLK